MCQRSTAHRPLYLFFQLQSWLLLLCLILPAMAPLGFGGLRKKWTPLSGAVEAPRRRGEHLGALS